MIVADLRVNTINKCSVCGGMSSIMEVNNVTCFKFEVSYKCNKCGQIDEEIHKMKLKEV